MDNLFYLMSSPEFKKVFYALGVGALFLAIGLVVVAFSFYGRGREGEEASTLDPKWVMLFATFRDSLIITILYTAEAFLYRYSDFMGLREMSMMNVMSAYHLVQPLLVYIFDILIFAVAALRVIALTRFLARAKHGAGASPNP